MTHQELLQRVSINPAIFDGKPCVRGTRKPIAIILDGMAEGLSSEQIIDHYPQLTLDDIHAVLAYGHLPIKF